MFLGSVIIAMIVLGVVLGLGGPLWGAGGFALITFLICQNSIVQMMRNAA